MQQLTGLDAAFLAMETDNVFGHVASVIVLDPSTAPEPLTLELLTALIERRLHLIPPFRRRLVTVPLGLDQPYWIEDPDFDLEYHVREIALPEPGNDKQLGYQAARLHARPLDRRRPLWEIYLIHGLEGGRKAIYSKVHHAAIDGVSGNDILAAVLDLTPEGRPEEEPPPWQCDEEPGALRMLAKSAVSLAGHPLRAARLTYDLTKSVPMLATSPARPHLPVVDRLLRRDANVLPNSAGLRAPRTPFNRPVGPHRRWSFCTVPLGDVKAVKNAHGCTVNDVIVSICAGAVRRWLIEHDELPDSPLVAQIPVSVRTEEQIGTYGNRIMLMGAALLTDVADPVERLRGTHEALGDMKQRHRALPASLLTDANHFIPPAVFSRAARLTFGLATSTAGRPVWNLVVSNVPGPQFPLYCAGAKLVANYPVSVITHGMGLNITVMSYMGHLDFGIVADREQMPDVARLIGWLGEELALLMPLAAARPAPPPANAKRMKRTPKATPA